jgi:glycerate kinase
MRAAALVIAGEGCIDDHSFGGKIVGELVRRAHESGVPIHAVVGSSKLSEEARERLGLQRVWIASTLDELATAGRELGAAVAAALVGETGRTGQLRPSDS